MARGSDRSTFSSDASSQLDGEPESSSETLGLRSEINRIERGEMLGVGEGIGGNSTIAESAGALGAVPRLPGVSASSVASPTAAEAFLGTGVPRERCAQISQPASADARMATLRNRGRVGMGGTSHRAGSPAIPFSPVHSRGSTLHSSVSDTRTSFIHGTRRASPALWPTMSSRPAPSSGPSSRSSWDCDMRPRGHNTGRTA